MAYWTDIFTLETWAQAEKKGYSVTGFPAPTKTKGGYSARMFERVSPGDILLCYCKGPAVRPGATLSGQCSTPLTRWG